MSFVYDKDATSAVTPEDRRAIRERLAAVTPEQVRVQLERCLAQMVCGDADRPLVERFSLEQLGPALRGDLRFKLRYDFGCELSAHAIKKLATVDQLLEAVLQLLQPPAEEAPVARARKKPPAGGAVDEAYAQIRGVLASHAEGFIVDDSEEAYRLITRKPTVTLPFAKLVRSRTAKVTLFAVDSYWKKLAALAAAPALDSAKLSDRMSYAFKAPLAADEREALDALVGAGRDLWLNDAVSP